MTNHYDDNEELIPGLDPEELPEATNEFGADELETPDDFGDDGDDLFGGVDPAIIVTIQPANGRAVSMVVEQPTPLRDLIVRSGLTFNGSLDAFVEGDQARTMDDMILPGQTVTLLGNVKGGTR